MHVFVVPSQILPPVQFALVMHATQVFVAVLHAGVEPEQLVSFKHSTQVDVEESQTAVPVQSESVLQP